MQALSQILAITLVNIRSIPQRLGSSVVAIVGIAGVVVVFVSVLSIAQGFRAAMTTAGDPRTAIVLRSGTDSEMSSGLSREQTQIVKDAPGLTRGADGPIASAELFVIVNHPKRSTGTDANVPLRGVESGAFAVRPRLKLVEGRRFEPGRNEIIVGRAAAGQFAGLAVGNDVRWGRTPGKSSASSRPTGPSPNQSSGATRRSCRARTDGVTRSSPCTSSSSARTRWSRSGQHWPAIRGSM